MMETGPEPRRRITPQLLMGLVIIAVGVLFTLDNLGMLEAQEYLRYWPAGLVAIGGLKLWQARGDGGMLAGLLFVLAGTWLLLESFAVITVSFWELWPVLLVAFGVSLVWRGFHGRRERVGTDADATVNSLAVLGRISRGNNSRAFRGGDLTAVLGGCEIDLRQSAIDGEAVLDVFAMWGGIEIRVPEDWRLGAHGPGESGCA